MIEDMDDPTGIQDSMPCCGTCKLCGWTTDLEKANELYCHRCGAKTYLSDNGSHRRCPICDDRKVIMRPFYLTDYWNFPNDKWIITYSE